MSVVRLTPPKLQLVANATRLSSALTPIIGISEACVLSFWTQVRPSFVDRQTRPAVLPRYRIPVVSGTTTTSQGLKKPGVETSDHVAPKSVDFQIFPSSGAR